MNAKSKHRILFVSALGLCLSFPALSHAACCGMGTTAYYQPAAYTAYSPAAYTSYYGGWYPGYWLDRIRTRLWGSPTTYVAAYPSTYAASYAPSYSVGYRPAYSVGYATSYAAPAVGCSSCSACPTCPSYSVGYSSCGTCTTCAAPAVSQAVYQQPAGCASCATPAAVVAPAPAMAAPAPQGAAPPAPTPAPQSTYGTQNGAPPYLSPGATVPERQQETQRPANGTQNGTQNGAQQEIQPEPGNDTNGKDPYDVNGESSTYFQAPKLFDPSDRTAQRSIAPVTTALYEKPVSYRNVSLQRITAEQAQLDAAGWISAK